MGIICFPLPYEWTDFPKFISKHGTFGAVRTHDIHTGVDLYTREGAPILAVEDGVVVAVEQFTGAPESPWWLPTQAVLVEGENGVFVYGEVVSKVKVDSVVRAGQTIAEVSPVLKPGDERSDIPGHSRFMLHLELHTKGTRQTSWWKKGESKPPSLLDPMPFLVRSWNERSIRRTNDKV